LGSKEGVLTGVGLPTTVQTECAGSDGGGRRGGAVEGADKVVEGLTAPVRSLGWWQQGRAVARGGR
jgi:hypothetical protein